MPPARTFALLVTFGQAFWLSSGETFKLEKRPIPSAYSLQGLSAFTVYAPPDGPPAKADDGPFVEFKGLQAHSTDPNKGDVDLENYASLQLSLISKEDYDSHIAKGPLCIGDQLSSEGTVMHMNTVGFTKSQFLHKSLNKTGVYFLIMSNCGNVSLAEVSGQVAVRNPFGYMSGTEYHKMTFYGYTTVVYMALAIIWGGLCLTWMQELIAIHAIVGLVIGLKLLECVCWTVHLYTMNLSGDSSDAIVCVLVMLTTLTCYTSYTFILVIAQGWRMTEEVVDDWMLLKMGLFGVVWVVISYLREGAMVHRQTFQISFNFMTLTAVGSFVVNIMIFAWIFSSLARLSRHLKDRSLDEQLKAVSRFTVALICSLAASVLVALLQLLDSMGSLQVSWKYQYFADGGLSQVNFACMVVVAMWVWMPKAGSAQLGYSLPVGQNEEDGLWKEDGGEDNVEHDGGNKAPPATLGAADQDRPLIPSRPGARSTWRADLRRVARSPSGGENAAGNMTRRRMRAFSRSQSRLFFAGALRCLRACCNTASAPPP
ncbi:unnamed protein product [Prorocentrum cordatum]|uniref:GOST seven transmembrane domain-containing protein n=1 Tax=Prorocentrum cordatum TaxID=2364126 RepID=A0ABN9SE79_9DINO|nr:unnamed protein product [Polarella glacialis]